MQSASDEPQPQDLTPREWQVLELLRRGFADYQIAQVLGIAEGEARAHASNVLAKLQIPPEQLATWRPDIPPPDTTRTIAPQARRPIPSALKFIAGGAAILVAAAVIAIALALILDSNDKATAPVDEQTSSLSDEPVPPFITDHWHAIYEVDICGEEQAPIATFTGGIHTHGDGYIHIHPFTEEEEGYGARLVKFFEYAGGDLTNETLLMPGEIRTWRTGLTCPDGRLAFLQVIVNGTPLTDIEQYIPQDNDHILISFNP